MNIILQKKIIWLKKQKNLKEFQVMKKMFMGLKKQIKWNNYI